MNAKTTKVALQCDALGVTQDFEITHAERLLKMQNNGGWVLPKNSDYIFENGTINKRNKKADNRAKKSGDN